MHHRYSYSAISLQRTVLPGIIALLLFCHAEGRSQNSEIDSLRQELVAATDTTKVNVLYALSIAYIDIDLHRAQKYGNKAMQLAVKLSYSKGRGLALRAEGYFHTIKGDYPKAKAVFDSSLVLLKKVEYDYGIVLVYDGLQYLYRMKGELDAAKKILEKSIELSKELGHERSHATALLNLGIVLEQQGHIPEAAKYFETAIRKAEERNDSVQLCRALTGFAYVQTDDAKKLKYLKRAYEISEKILGNTVVEGANIAQIYIKMKDYDRAYEYLERCLKQAQKVGDLHHLAQIRHLIAKVFAETGRKKEAIEFHQLNLRWAEECGNKATAIFSLLEITTLERQRGNLGASIESGLKALEVSNSIGGRNYIRNSHGVLSTTYATTGDYQNAYIHYVQYSELSDSLFNEESRRSIDELTAKYEALKRDKKIELLDKESQLQAGIIARQDLLRNIIIGSVIILLIVVLLYFRGLRHKRNASELRALAAEAEALALRAEAEQIEKKAQVQFARRLIASQEDERKRIAADLHDSLSQKLIIIRNRALLSLRETDLKSQTQDQFKMISDAAATTLEEMRMISRDLRPILLDRFGLSETIRGTMEQVEETSRTKWTIDVEDIDNDFVPGEDINLYRIIQEAVNNILKHANADEAELKVKKINSDILITVRDNGRGFEAPSVMENSNEGFGLRSIRERAKILGGAVAIESEPGHGSFVSIVIPAI